MQAGNDEQRINHEWRHKNYVYNLYTKFIQNVYTNNFPYFNIF